MSRHRLVLPRPLGVALALGLGSALVVSALAASSPATATPTADGNAQVGTTYADSGAAGCSTTFAGDSPSATDIADNQSISASVSSTSKTTNSADATDQTPMAASSRVTATQRVAHDALVSLNATEVVSSAIKPAQIGSACAGEVTSGAALTSSFRVPTDGFLTVTTTVSAGIESRFAILSNTVDTSSTSTGTGIPSTTTQRFLVKEGGVLLGFSLSDTLDAPTATDQPTSLRGTGRIHVTFSRLGAATGKATGRGTAYIAYPAALNCAKDRILLKTRPRTKNASSALFTVNGHLLRTVDHPGASVGIGLNVPADQDVVILSVVRVKRVDYRSTRTYTACS